MIKSRSPFPPAPDPHQTHIAFAAMNNDSLNTVFVFVGFGGGIFHAAHVVSYDVYYPQEAL